MVEKYFTKHTIELMDSNHTCSKGLTTVRDIFKEYLTLLHTPYHDDLGAVSTLVPLRYNVTTSSVERYDPITKTWIVVTITGGGGPSLLTYRYTDVAGNFVSTDRVLEVGAAVTITMSFTPPPTVGIEYHIKNSSAGVVTVNGGTYLIDGAATHPIPAGEARRFFFNTANKFIII